MDSAWKRTVFATGAVVGLSVCIVGCLTRPVQSTQPTLETQFTDTLNNSGVDKLDILFMIDNSASMGDKQKLLADAVPDMITRLVTPNCIDGATGGVVGRANETTGACDAGSPEFAAVHDMHIGIVSSSLGGRGGGGQNDECPTAGDGVWPDGGATTPQHNDDKGELLNRAGADEHALADLQPDHYLAWFPSVVANRSGSASPQPAITSIGETVAVESGAAPVDGSLIGDFQDMIVGVHERGCGYEAQLESWYRFLIEPNPYAAIVYNQPTNGAVATAAYQGVDVALLAQRAAFLRPDSLVAVVVVSDENQEVANPLALGGAAWAFESSIFPGSPTGFAPEGTMACQSDPMSDQCVTCALESLTAADRATQCANLADSGPPLYYYPSQADDNPNIRFFHQRQRFGVDVGYPSSRYVSGLTSATVPNRDGSNPNCTNPLFAASPLPVPSNSDDTTTDLCNLTPGHDRTPGGNLVFYAAITGVPHELLQDPECLAGPTPDECPQVTDVGDAGWVKILGQDPENYNFQGVDFHMLESAVPRTQAVAQAAGAINYATCLPPAPGVAANDTCDPINGREYDTTAAGFGYADLQYACTFKLGTPKNCADPAYDQACDCEQYPDGGIEVANGASSLCQQGPSPGSYTTTQTSGKAYPGIEELLVARGMGKQGIVSSLCPIHTSPDLGNPDDPLYGYRPAVTAIIDRLKSALEVACPPHKLTVDSSGMVPNCLVLATFNDGTATCASAGTGYSDVSNASVLADFKQSQHDMWVNKGGAALNTPDPSTLLTCEVTPLSAPCASRTDTQGWCYVENTSVAAGDAGGGCSYQIQFAAGGPEKRVTASLTCIEQSGTTAFE
jgi:hypothetical protein